MKLAEILARLAAINNRMAAIRTEANTEGTTTERMAELDSESTALDKERAELTKQAVILRSEAQNFAPVVPTEEAQPEERSEDYYASIAYRKAFKTWVLERKATPALRADASTTTNGISSVIVPTVITDQLYVKKDNAGSIFARVRKTNYPAGVSIKTVNFAPVLEWVAENGKTDRKSATTGEITFSGYKGQIRLAISLESKTMSLEQFEAALVDRILKACSRGFDRAIVAGSGSGQPTGIITASTNGAVYTGNSSNAVTLNNKTVEDYGEWIKVWSKIPLAEQAGAKLHINKVDWQAHILGMKDSTGKVIALETMGFGGNLVPMFMGKEVVLLEDQGLPEFDTITGSATKSATTAFAYFFNDDAYCFNSNLQLSLRQYIDEETDETIHKATVIADGKIVDKSSLLIVCRGADAS